MKIKSSNYPAVKILIIVLLGTAIGSLFKLSFSEQFIFLVIILIISIVLFVLENRNLAYVIMSLSIGFYLSFQLNNLSVKSPDKISPEFSAILEGKIIKTMKKNDKYYRCIIEGRFDAKMLPSIENTRVLLTIYGFRDKQNHLGTGAKIYAIAKATLPQKAILPADFPEAQYYSSINVQWKARAYSRNVSIIEEPHGFSAFRENVVSNIQNRISILFPESTACIVNALLTGDKTQIPYEIRQSFSLSGTAHVLAVSGLHVGIISAIIFVALGFIQNRWLKFILFAIGVAMFVVLTGLQASSLRAGLMAIAILLAKTWQRHINLINIIALVVLLLLLLFPEMLLSVGFQMSVAAISGIALLYRPFSNFLRTFLKAENIFINFLISSLSVSMAASIVVSPIVAYYFQVYSIISPLANLIVIPMMTLSMVFSIISFALSYIYLPLAILYSSSANFLITLSQRINDFAINLPFAYLQGDDLVLISILISFSIIYINFSEKLKTILFRTIISISVFSLIILTTTSNEDKIQIFPRKQYVAVSLPSINNMKEILLIDRKPAQKPNWDYAMDKYILSFKDSLLIGYSGNAGLSIVDRIKRKRKLASFELSIEFQKRLYKLLKLDRQIPQIISTDVKYSLRKAIEDAEEL